MPELSDSQSMPAIRTVPRHRPMRSSKWVTFNVIIPLLLLALGVFVLRQLGTVQPQRRPDADKTRIGRLRSLPPVRVVQLQSLENTGQKLRLRVDGEVVPYREAKVAAEVAGRIVFKSDLCEAGNYVVAGELLMRIDPTDHELEVQRLTRLQEQEYQALGEIDQEMVNTKRLIEVAKDDVELQQREVDRQQALPAGFASRAEIDQANRALLAAKQQLVTSENQLDLLRKRRVRLEASERLAVTQLKLAQINLQRTEIRAPIDGVIVNEDADLNTFVARGNLLVTIEDTSKVEVATSLRMDQLYWILNQDQLAERDLSRGYDLPETPAIIKYELSGRDGIVYRWHGRLLSYDGIGVDPVTRTVPVRVVVDQPTEIIGDDGQVKSVTASTALVRGMYVRVDLLIKPRATLVAIPARALQPGNRVFQFVPDESVLESPAGPTEPTPPKTVTAATTNTLPTGSVPSGSVPAEFEPTESDQTRGMENFDPDHWNAGRVIVRSQIHPVDSLMIGPPGNTAAENRVWVCEVRDELLTHGSYVVVSPIGNIESGGMPARAERSNSEPLGSDIGTRQESSQPNPDRAPDPVRQPGEATVLKHERSGAEAS
jgi:multidrug efflux pump subunit AcrA (membrane-fusion protein)